MLIPVHQRLPKALEPWQTPDFRVALTSEERQRFRLRKALPTGDELALVLDRTASLRPGDHLVADDGRVLRVEAAPEQLAEVASGDAEQLARAAYHLGNRHVALQVGAGWLRFAADHVLEQMVVGLGFAVRHVEAPFVPEAGAYHTHATHAHPHSGHAPAPEPAVPAGDKHDNLPRQGTPFAYSPRIHEFDPSGDLKRSG